MTVVLMTSIVHWLVLLAGVHVAAVWVAAVWRALRARQRCPPEKIHTPNVWPFASVIIPAWRERGTLEFCIATLQDVDYPSWEAIVVAGGPDGTLDAALKVCAGDDLFRVIEQQPCGKNAALNLGYAQAHGEIIVLLDADCLVEPEWLTHLVAPLAQGYAASLANYFVAERTWVSDEFEMEKIAAHQIRHSTILHGGGIALHRSVIEELGGFPEAVTVGVDWDLDQRVARLGAKKIFVPEACHITHLPATLGRYLRDRVRWQRAHLQATIRFFERTPASARVTVASLSFYVMGLFFFAAPLVGVALAPIAPWALQLWPAFWAWILLRRMGLGIEVLVYTRDGYWLRRIWVPPVLLVVSFLSAIVALLTWRKRVVFFQGPRPHRA